ncbi:MAG: phosphohydrolase [Synergistaceae bacterium]|nr:phosphohydrolase [Synergistaceae bacterium]
MSSKKTNGLLHIISHTDLDGVTAAALAWHVHHAEGNPIRVSLTGYGEVDNLIIETFRSGGRMIALDLSPQFQATVDEIDTSFPQEGTPFLFDHHASTFEKLSNRPWIVLDVNRCGAAVYWDWLHSGNADEKALGRVRPLDGIVKVANDRDLWINENPDGRLWQAMVTMCGEWGAFARLVANPGAAFTDSERDAVHGFVARQEERFQMAREHLTHSRIGGANGPGDMSFLGDGYLEFGDTSDFCGMILDRPEDAKKAPLLVALAYKKPGGNWAVSLRSREGLAGRVVSLLKDGRRIRGGGHGDAAALYFPSNYSESGIKDSIVAALAAQNESSSGLGVTLGDLLKGAL